MADATSPSVTPPEGKTTIDDKMFFEPCRLSYQSAVEIANRVADGIKREAYGQTVVIAGVSLLADFANLQAAYLMLEGLQKEYESLSILALGLANRRGLPAPVEVERVVDTNAVASIASLATGLSPVTAALSAVLGLGSLFREDVEYHGVTTAVDSLAFELAIAARVKAHGANKVFVPDLMAFELSDPSKSKLRTRLAAVQSAKASAWAGAGPLISELVGFDASLDEAARSGDQALFDILSAKSSDLRRDLRPISESLSRSDQRLAEFHNQWNQASEGSALSKMARLLRAEAIHSVEPLYLHAQVVVSGGHHRITRNLFRMLFLGDGLSFAGGSIVRWALLGSDGSVSKGGVVTIRRNARFSDFPPADGWESLTE